MVCLDKKLIHNSTYVRATISTCKPTLSLNKLFYDLTAIMQ